MIVFDKVSFGYQSGRLILADLSLQIEAREKVCLLGLNGSGKSTLLKLAAGLLVPTGGRVLIDGIEPGADSSATKLRARLAFMFQDPQDQIVATTVAADLAFAPENLGYAVDTIRNRVSAMAERFGLIDLMSRHPAAISGGEQQRTALAGALAPGPDVVLLDESTSYLDSQGKARLYDTILADPSLTVLAATQYPEEARLFGRVLLLHEGSVVFSGRHEEFFESPAWRQVAVCPATDSDAGEDSRERPVTGRHGTLLSAESLYFGYQEEEHVLREVSLKVSAGEVLAVVGASGSGKTTLGLLLAGLLPPRVGEVRHSSGAGQSASVGFLMQFPEAQFFAETVHDEIAFGLLPQGLAAGEIRRRVEGVLVQMGLAYLPLARRSPFVLSGGEQRRVAIASALVRAPDILILDEPTVALDWQGAGQLARLLCHLRRQGRALVILSHDLDFISRIATNIALLHRGNLRWSGSKFAADFPCDTFAAEFGAIPQSLTEARELRDKGWSPEAIEMELARFCRP